MTLHGGCQCRKVRYTINCDIAKVQKNFCHCRMCQLATGSPVAAFFTIPEVRVCVLGVSVALGTREQSLHYNMLCTAGHCQL